MKQTSGNADAKGTRHVFVYGTLRRGGSNDITRLTPAPVWIGEAEIAGTLYDFGRYPGVVLGGSGRVTGEVYAVDATLERILDEIDHVRDGAQARQLDGLGIVEVALQLIEYIITEFGLVGHHLFCPGEHGTLGAGEPRPCMTVTALDPGRVRVAGTLALVWTPLSGAATRSYPIELALDAALVT